MYNEFEITIVLHINEMYLSTWHIFAH